MPTFKNRPYPPPAGKCPASADTDRLKTAFLAIEAEIDRLQTGSLSMKDFEYAEYLRNDVRRLKVNIREAIRAEREREQLGLFG